MLASDQALREHVQDELLWDPQIDASAIGVSVKDAVVTLSGTVESYIHKHAAGEIVTKIRGVRALANKIDVKLPADADRCDEDIARTIAMIFEWNTMIPKHQIHVEVSQGWVTLAGSVHWHCQRAAAEHTVRGLMGIKGITNAIEVEPINSLRVTQADLQSAMKRNLDSEHTIDMILDNDIVILSGPVRTLVERGNVERIAWNAPGVRYVQNEIEIVPL